MRHQLMQVLQADDDDAQSEVLRRFWTRAEAPPARTEPRAPARVIDLAQWARERRVER
jgi:hypothetical protein